MFRIIKKSLKTGVVTGRYPESTAPVPHVTDETKAKAAPFANSLTIREVDTGSCNACGTLKIIRRITARLSEERGDSSLLPKSASVRVNRKTTSHVPPKKKYPHDTCAGILFIYICRGSANRNMQSRVRGD